jgi:hypothetical protein
MRKTTGWLLVVLGVLWAATVIKNAPPSGPDGLGTSSLIGGLMIPILVSLGGLALAGVIKKSK